MDASTRREFLSATAATIALIESGRRMPAWAEDKFTIASTGGSWGEGIREFFCRRTKICRNL